MWSKIGILFQEIIITIVQKNMAIVLLFIYIFCFAYKIKVFNVEFLMFSYNC